MRNLLSTVITLSLFVFITLFSLPGVSYAVPVAPSQTCAVNATVLNIRKTKTQIGGHGTNYSYVDYYAVKLKIESSTIYNLSCDYYINKELDSILSLTEYDKSPISVGQKINANIRFGGDEWFNGSFLSSVKIISTGLPTTKLNLPSNTLTVGIMIIILILVSIIYKIALHKKQS